MQIKIMIPAIYMPSKFVSMWEEKNINIKIEYLGSDGVNHNYLATGKNILFPQLLDFISDNFPDNHSREAKYLEGVIIGLELAKTAWDKGLGRDDISNNITYYREELAKLNGTAGGS